MNTHYGVIVFSGDPAREHPDPDLNGHPPSMTLIATGPEDFCWRALGQWTAKHPLRMWEEAEVLARDTHLVEQQKLMADAAWERREDGNG